MTGAEAVKKLVRLINLKPLPVLNKMAVIVNFNMTKEHETITMHSR